MSLLDRKLEIFRMAATLNHFSEAAAALGMTQPNVSRQMTQLETELGTALFERDGRRLKLTSAGSALLRECSRLFTDATRLTRMVRNAAAAIRHYRIGATMTAGGYVLPELAALYMRKNSTLRLDLHIANTGDICEQLKTRQLDLGLVEGPFDRQYFHSRTLLADELRPVAPPGVLPDTFSLEEYRQNGGRFVLREPGSGTRWHFDRFLQEHHLTPPQDDRIIEANSFDAIKHLVRNGEGITVISELAVTDEIKAGSLRCFRFSEGTILRKMNFLFTDGAELAFVEEFIRFCRQHHTKS